MYPAVDRLGMGITVEESCETCFTEIPCFSFLSGEWEHANRMKPRRTEDRPLKYRFIAKYRPSNL